MILRILLPLLVLAFFAASCEQRVDEIVDDWERTYDLSHLNAIILTGEGFHDAETMVPLAFLRQRGASVTIAGIEQGTVTAYNSNHTVDIATSVTDINIEDYDLMIIPGGHAPENIRQNEDIVDFTRRFFMADKVVAAICHGPLVLVSAGVLAERTLTGVPAIEDDILQAQGIFMNAHAVIDRNLITSRVPGDIPDFCRAIAIALTENAPVQAQ
jgi:protease I